MACNMYILSLILAVHCSYCCWQCSSASRPFRTSGNTTCTESQPSSCSTTQGSLWVFGAQLHQHYRCMPQSMYVHLHKHAQVLHEEASNVQGTSASVNQLSSAHYGFSLWIVVDTIWPPYIYIYACMPMHAELLVIEERSGLVFFDSSLKLIGILFLSSTFLNFKKLRSHPVCHVVHW